MAHDPNDPRPEDIPAYKYPASSNYGREMRKWDLKKSQGGMNTDRFEKFPMMLYRALEIQGKWVTFRPEPEFDQTYRNEAAWDRDCRAVKKFNEDCQRIVKNQTEYEQALSSGEGWRESYAEALAFREGLEREIAAAALERINRDKKMSPAAQAEAQRADEATAEHLAEIPETPVRRRGRAAGAA